jgi:protein gp37
MTKIQWTEKTWNPIVGCSKVSAGCQNCYAINQAYRNAAMGSKLPTPGRLAYYEGLTEKRGDRVEWSGVANFVPEALEIPLKTKKATTWFVNSMSDLFHESVRDEWIDQVLAVMCATPQHTYQVLTKRPDRMLSYVKALLDRLKGLSPASGKWNHMTDAEKTLANLYWYNFDRKPGYFFPLRKLWLGVSVENQKAADERIPLLLQAPAAIRFLSCEPLLEEISFTTTHPEWRTINLLTGETPYSASAGAAIDWVIVGGESGHNARPCDADWIRAIVQQCKSAKVPVFVKQLGSRPIIPCRMPGDAGWDEFGPIYRTTGKGSDPEEWPEDLRVREMPNGS